MTTSVPPRTPQRPWSLRALDRERDGPAIVRLDTTVLSHEEYVVHHDAAGAHLVRRALATARAKTFPLDLDADPWEHGVVAVADGAVRGFVATALQGWNQRLVLWHLYVDAPWRGRGLGRALLEHALDHGRAHGARTAWAETSSHNGPGIAAYERLGFSICGFDASLYVATPAEGEVAVFLSRPLAEPSPPRNG